MSGPESPWHEEQRARLAEGEKLLPYLPRHIQRFYRDGVTTWRKLIATIEPRTALQDEHTVQVITTSIDELMAELVVISDALRGQRPADPGSWQARAIAAEMEAATQRVRIGELERKVREAERGRAAAIEVAERPLARARQEVARQRVWLDDIAEVAAQAYHRSSDYAELTTPPDYDPEWVPTGEELYEFIAETLGGEHPSVTYPAPSSATIGKAVHRFRSAIGSGASIEDALHGVLAQLAGDERERRQSEVARLHGEIARATSTDSGEERRS